MSPFHILLATTCAVILFLFAIESFSREVQQVTGEKFRKFLSKGTRNPILGSFLGAGVTSIIQSSTATSVITVGLVNAGVLSFKNSLGIIFGANVGTTVTAQLVAFKLTDIAPYFIILGFALSFVRTKYKFIGKSVFFFGLVFFTLNLISSAVAPLQSNPELLRYLAEAKNPLYGVLLGAAITALVQSSSVTTGLTVVMLQNQLMDFDAALPVVLGANIGTTVTALLASVKMDIAGKRTALAHFSYNVGGVLVFIPLVLQVPNFIEVNEANASHVLANVHLVFNGATAALFLALVTPFSRVLEKILPSKEEEFLSPIAFPSITKGGMVDESLNFLEDLNWKLLELLKKNYNFVTLALESKEEGLLKRCIKNQSYLSYLKSEVQDFISQLSPQIENEAHSRRLVYLVNRLDYLYQISDSMDDLIEMNQQIFARQTTFSVESIMGFREISSEMLKVFESLPLAVQSEDRSVRGRMSRSLSSYRKAVDEVYKTLLQTMSIKGDQSFVHLARFLSLNQRIKDKLHSFYRLASAKNQTLASEIDSQEH